MNVQNPSASRGIVIQAVDLVKNYGTGSNMVHALRGVNVSFERGKFTAIMGPSGSGKSTLMHTLAGLDSATSGHILFGGADLTRMDDKQLTLLRRHKIGFIFQSFNLLPMFTAEARDAAAAALFITKKKSSLHLMRWTRCRSPGWQGGAIVNCPVASSSGCCWPARWCTNRASC